MSNKRKKDIAIFRYGLIAPVIHENTDGQMKYFREISLKEYEVPHIGTRKFKVGTFKSWLRKYRENGIEGITPKIRKDKGVLRKIDEELKLKIDNVIKEFSTLTCSAIYRHLVSQGSIDFNGIKEGTLRKYITTNNLKEKNNPVPRKKFEKEHINDLWITDAMHGPYIVVKNKKRKTYLIAIIDDRSRVIVGGMFFHHENSISLEHVLKEAIGKFGLPKILYCDNGSMFVSSHLQYTCARLGIALVHSKPYDSPSRGKIERYFRTVRGKFLPFVSLQTINNISELTDAYTRWNDKEYNRFFHHGINGIPMDRYITELSDTKIKRVTKTELDDAFQVTIKRKVKNDSTVSINNSVYECPHKFIGKTVEIRYASDNPLVLTIYENSKPVSKLNKINIHENANPPAWGIHFSKEENQ